MPRPKLSPIGEDLYEAFGWWASQDEDNGWTLAHICDAWARIMFDPIYEIVGEGEDGEAGWSIALDPEKCPEERLPYLAQWVGAVLTPGMSEEQKRAEIKEPTGWKRGQVPSIELIVKRGLTDTQWVRIRPRTPGPGEIYIRTLLSETPHPERVEAELLEHGIPAWELLDYEAIEGITYTDVAAGWETYEDLAKAFPTYDALAHALPDELP